MEIQYPEIKGMNESQAEKWFLKNLGNIPVIWDDPLERANLLDSNIQAVCIEANLTNFEISYKDRLGEQARSIGYQRNIAMQSPGNERDWLNREKT